jgi:opacity protein-like surface antigen
MKPRFVVAAILTGALALASTATAQTRDHGYVIGIGGSTTTVVTSPFFGGAVGLNVTRDLLVTGEVGRMQNLYADFTRDDLRALEQGFTEQGLPFTANFEMSTVYAMGGVRWVVPTSYTARPYLNASVGIARLDPKPGFIASGVDITSIAMQDPTFKTAFEKQNRPLASFGGGVSVPIAKHFTADVGYRYSRIFLDTNYLQDVASPHSHKGFDVHRVYAGAGFAF